MPSIQTPPRRLIYGLTSLSTHEATLEFGVATSCLKHSIRGDFNRSTWTKSTLLKGGGSDRV